MPCALEPEPQPEEYQPLWVLTLFSFCPISTAGLLVIVLGLIFFEGRLDKVCGIEVPCVIIYEQKKAMKNWQKFAAEASRVSFITWSPSLCAPLVLCEKKKKNTCWSLVLEAAQNDIGLSDTQLDDHRLLSKCSTMMCRKEGALSAARSKWMTCRYKPAEWPEGQTCMSWLGVAVTIDPISALSPLSYSTFYKN